LEYEVSISGRSAAWLAHLPWAQGVGGSNPLAPIFHHRQLIQSDRKACVGTRIFLCGRHLWATATLRLICSVPFAADSPIQPSRYVSRYRNLRSHFSNPLIAKQNSLRSSAGY